MEFENSKKRIDSLNEKTAQQELTNKIQLNHQDDREIDRRK